MKFVAAILTLAAVATAAPAEVVARTNPGGGSCNINGNNNGKVTCCGEGLLGGLLCNILPIGNACQSSQQTKCCETDATGGLINISLLNCVGILG